MIERKISEKYLQYRKRVLNYTNIDMNLALENDEQVYIAVFDIPLESNVIGFQTHSKNIRAYLKTRKGVF